MGLRKYERYTPPTAVIADIGYAPGMLGTNPITNEQRSALKYFGRRWLGLSREDVQGPLGRLRSAYDAHTVMPASNDDRHDAASEDAAEVETPEPTPTPEPVKPVETAAAAPIPSSDLASALAILGQHMKPGIDAAQVHSIVDAKLPGLTAAIVQTATDAILAKLPDLASVNPSVFAITIERPNVPKISKDAAPRHTVFRELLAATAAGENVLLVGPAGCGKTHICSQVAECLNLSFRFTGAVASEYKLSGFRDAHGNYAPTGYRQAYETGGVYLLDEMDGSSASALLYMNAGLANGEQDFPDAVVSRHADFRMVASANTYGNGADRQYVGRQQLDAASLDRFYVIPMDYDEDLELALYGDNDWTRYVQRVRKAVRETELRHVISMRAIASGHRALAAGISRRDVERAVIWKSLTKSDVSRVKSAITGA